MYDELYGLTCRGQNLMKLFLEETRQSELSNHINYKSMGLEMRELWIFEVLLWILSTVLTSIVVRNITCSIQLQIKLHQFCYIANI